MQQDEFEKQKRMQQNESKESKKNGVEVNFEMDYDAKKERKETADFKKKPKKAKTRMMYFLEYTFQKHA